MHATLFIALLTLADTPVSRRCEQTIGSWSSWVESTLVEGTRDHRAQSYRQVVFRDGPQGKERLFEAKSTGPYFSVMNDRGVVLVYGVGLANLFFPGKKEAVPLQLQGKPGAIASNAGHVFFLGETIVYGDSFQRVLLGTIEVDSEHQKLVGDRIIEPGTSTQELLGDKPPPIRLGSFIIFKDGAWEQQHTHVLNLMNGKLVALHDVPMSLLNAHRDEVLPFMEGDPP